MAPPKRPWFRFYVEAFGDPKLRRLTPEQRWMWAAVLGAARQSPEPGRLLLTLELPMESSDLADFAGVPARKMGQALEAMERLGLVERDGSVWVVPKFLDRQYESDNSAKRVRRHRSKNADVTPDETTIGRYIAVTETHQRQRQKTETEKHTPSSAGADGVPDRFDEFWAACPRKVGKAEARRKWARATKSTDPDRIIDAMRTHAAHWRAHGTEDRFIPHPATWLHQGRWLDELVSPSANDPPEFHRSAVLERNEARARGEVCELCSGTGWQPIDGTNDAEPCDCTRRETA